MRICTKILTITDVAAALYAGIRVERRPIHHIAGCVWLKTTGEVRSLDVYEYRTVEEWEPEKGDTVLAKQNDKACWNTREFRGVMDGKYICRDHNNVYIAWTEIRPTPPAPPPPRNHFPMSHEACDAFWNYWKENGETHKHGHYESTWGAMRAYLKEAESTKDQRAEPKGPVAREWYVNFYSCGRSGTLLDTRHQAIIRHSEYGTTGDKIDIVKVREILE